MKKKQPLWITLSALLLVAAGLLLTLYPWISNRLYEKQVDSTVQTYEAEVQETGKEEIRKLLQEAADYNTSLSRNQVTLTDPFVLEQEDGETDYDYEQILKMDDTGIMCFLEIPKIDVYLPVYHGTDTEVLMKGIGHIEGSSLPAGGTGSHAVLSGHTGVDKAKLFTDLTELSEGDLFFIHILGEIHAYRVVSIHVIEPVDTSRLLIEGGRDLVSLLTCTPYGVNTHRLVVTGERTEYSRKIVEESKEEQERSTSQWISAYQKALAMGIGAAGILLLMLRVLKYVWMTEKHKSIRGDGNHGG